MKYCTVAKSMGWSRSIWTSAVVCVCVACALRPVRSIPVDIFLPSRCAERYANDAFLTSFWVTLSPWWVLQRLCLQFCQNLRYSAHCKISLCEPCVRQRHKGEVRLIRPWMEVRSTLVVDCCRGLVCQEGRRWPSPTLTALETQARLHCRLVAILSLFFLSTSLSSEHTPYDARSCFFFFFLLALEAATTLVLSKSESIACFLRIISSTHSGYFELLCHGPQLCFDVCLSSCWGVAQLRTEYQRHLFFFIFSCDF